MDHHIHTRSPHRLPRSLKDPGVRSTNLNRLRPHTPSLPRSDPPGQESRGLPRTHIRHHLSRPTRGHKLVTRTHRHRRLRHPPLSDRSPRTFTLHRDDDPPPSKIETIDGLCPSKVRDPSRTKLLTVTVNCPSWIEVAYVFKHRWDSDPRRYSLSSGSGRPKTETPRVRHRGKHGPRQKDHTMWWKRDHTSCDTRSHDPPRRLGVPG